MVSNGAVNAREIAPAIEPATKASVGHLLFLKWSSLVDIHILMKIK